MAELSRRWPTLRNRAFGCGDRDAGMNLSSYLMSIVRLAAADPDTAGRELRQTMSQWSSEGYHVQHNDALWAAVQIALYRGDGPAAWDLIHRWWPALPRSLLLRVQFIPTEMHYLRARASPGGTRSREEIDRADRCMSDQKIQYPANLASMIVTPWPSSAYR